MRRPAARAIRRGTPPPLRPAPERHVAERRQRDQRADEAPRRFTDHHVAVVRLLLEARRHVDRIADDVVVGGADDDLARVDGDAETDVPTAAFCSRASCAEGLLHGDGGAHGAHGVVLGHAWQPERGHDAVAEQLDDRTAVGFDDRMQRPVVAVHQAAHGLRVEAFVQRRRADEVGEDDRDDLARLDAVGSSIGSVAAVRARLGVGDERPAARATEPVVRWIHVAAGRTGTSEGPAAAAAEAVGCGILSAARWAVHVPRAPSPVRAGARGVAWPRWAGTA